MAIAIAITAHRRLRVRPPWRCDVQVRTCEDVWKEVWKAACTWRGADAEMHARATPTVSGRVPVQPMACTRTGVVYEKDVVMQHLEVRGCDAWEDGNERRKKERDVADGTKRMDGLHACRNMGRVR